MDQKGDQNSMIIISGQNKITPHEPNNNTTTITSLKKNNKGSKNFFKVALFMMRGRRSRKSKMLVRDDESKSVWRKLVGSMRPLHLQDNDQSPPRNDNIHITPDHSSKMMTISKPSENSGDDGFESSSEFTNSPSPTSSRYASAVGLNEMVQEEEKEEEVVNCKENNNNNNDNDIGEGDEMIDAKAEQFIAQFYQQMRLQRLDVTDHYYQQISARSLGL